MGYCTYYFPDGSTSEMTLHTNTCTVLWYIDRPSSRLQKASPACRCGKGLRSSPPSQGYVSSFGGQSRTVVVVRKGASGKRSGLEECEWRGRDSRRSAIDEPGLLPSANVVVSCTSCFPVWMVSSVILGSGGYPIPFTSAGSHRAYYKSDLQSGYSHFLLTHILHPHTVQCRNIL